MSRHMQLTVTVRPYYQRDLEGAYPKLERHLRHINPELARSNPSLYQLAEQFDAILLRFDGTHLTGAVSRRREKLRDLSRKVSQHIADWKLAEADRLLYAIEDLFDEIEADLD